MLRSADFQSKEIAEKLKEKEERGDKDFEDEELLAQEREKEIFKSRMKDFYRMNNEILLENFQIYVAKEISQKFMGKEYRALDDVLLENAFYGYLNIAQKNIYNTLFL